MSVKATKGMLLFAGSEDGHNHEEREYVHELDPHVWLAVKQVQTI